MELSSEFFNLVLRYLFNISIIYILIMRIYQKYHEDKDFVFTYFMFNSLIFFFGYILGNMDINIGFAFGLFAVFAILRYRTNPIPIKEMTYLFIVITIGVINSIGLNQVTYNELLFVNIILLIMTYTLEYYGKEELLARRTLEYDILENLKPENHKNLVQDLEEKTGLVIKRFEIGRTFIDKANIKIFYKD